MLDGHGPAGLARAHVCLAAAAVCLLVISTQAQGLIEARAASVTGRVLLSNGGSVAPFALTRGFALNPGDRLDTRGGGQLVIDLSDGSIVVVQPESVVVLKDFRAAGSLRELLEITLGRVRVKINHFGGRPNPYRMNSPTASIAVRGTEFSVDVDAQGDTQVVVYEGAVEVSSLTDPSRRVLIEAGRGVMVRPGQDLRPFAPPPGGRDMGDRGADPGDRDRRAQAGANRPFGPGGPPDQGRSQTMASGRAMGNGPVPGPPGQGPPSDRNQPIPHIDSDANSPRAAAGTYERYIAGLAEIGQTPFLLRFNAFPEAHLDSLENPAYAAGFRTGEARLFFLPSCGTQSYPQNLAFVSGGTQPSSYSLSPQFSMFVPVGSQFVIGGGMTTSRVNSDAQAALQRTAGSANSTYWSGSLLASTRFGAGGRSGFGLEIEKLKDTGDLSNISLVPPRPSADTLRTASDISQTRITAGVSHAFAGRHTLGVFYRHGFIDARDADTSHMLDQFSLPLESTRSAGHSSEFGLRLRGPVTDRLFYGIDGSLIGLSLDDALVRAGTPDSHQRDRARRAAAGAGLGYLLTPRVILSFDAVGGSSTLTARQFENATSELVQNGSGGSRFVSFHGALQADLSPHLFMNASLLAVVQGRNASYTVFGDRSPIGDSFFPVPVNPYQRLGKYSDFGLGWRISPAFFCQYVYSTDYGYTAASHTIMLRYTIRLQREK